MKSLPATLSLLAASTFSLFAQVNAPDADTALRRFLGIRSVGSTVPISEPASVGFATVLVFKNGTFSNRIGDTSILFNFGQIPVALGNSAAGYAPATVKVEFLWGPRDGKVGYILQAAVGTTGVMPDFTEMPELASIDTTLSEIYQDPSHPEFDGMLLLGTAYALTKPPKGESVEDMIQASDIALLVVFKQFQSDEEMKTFLKILNEKYKN